MTLKKTAYIPIEIKRRELTSQILLADLLIKFGYRVFIGTHAAISTLLKNKNMTGGVYLDKSIPVIGKLVQIREKVGFIGVLDQELGPLLQHSEKELASDSFLQKIISERIPRESVEFVDFFVTLGEPYTSIAKGVFGPEKTLAFGWPRFDLLHPKYRKIFDSEISKLRERYGSYSLYVSNFSYIGDLEKMKNSRHSSTLLNGSYNMSDYEIDQVDFYNTIQVLREYFASRNEKNFLVVRPHPGENTRPFRKYLQRSRNIKITRTGEIYPWLLACDKIFHRGSTSSLQAIFAQIPSVFIEEGDKGKRFLMSREVSTGVLRDNKIYFNDKEVVEQRRQLLSNRVVNFGNSSKLLSAYIGSLNNVYEPAYSFRVMLKGYISLRALRRSFGLVRDEIYFLINRLSVLPQSAYVPMGIQKRDISKVLRTLHFGELPKIKRVGINLISIEER